MPLRQTLRPPPTCSPIRGPRDTWTRQPGSRLAPDCAGPAVGVQEPSERVLHREESRASPAPASPGKQSEYGNSEG
ncbi:hypothetical protein H8959_019510 [Pygathrix nigripes]